MESSVIGLELVYEHRNHVPGIAVLFAVAYLPTAGAAEVPVSRSLLAVLIGSCWPRSGPRRRCERTTGRALVG